MHLYFPLNFPFLLHRKFTKSDNLLSTQFIKNSQKKLWTQLTLSESHQCCFLNWCEAATCNAHLFPRPNMLFPEVVNMIITGNKRPSLVLLSRYNIRINLILLAVCCISIFISPHLSIIHFMEKCQGWRGEGAGRTYRHADTHGCMINVCIFSSQTHSLTLSLLS